MGIPSPQKSQIPNNSLGLGKGSTVTSTSNNGGRDDTMEEVKFNNNTMNNNNGQTVDTGDIRKIKIYQIDKPAEKKYRRAGKEDETLFNFLGLSF